MCEIEGSVCVAYSSDVPVARDVRHIRCDVGTRAAEEQQLEGRRVHRVEELFRRVADVALRTCKQYCTLAHTLVNLNLQIRSDPIRSRVQSEVTSRVPALHIKRSRVRAQGTLFMCVSCAVDAPL